MSQIQFPTFISVICFALTASCGSENITSDDIEATSPRDTIEVGEYRSDRADGLFMLCKDHRTYKVVGTPVADLNISYEGLRKAPGAPVKAWLEGHLALHKDPTSNLKDSVFMLVQVHHLAAALYCAVVPDAKVAGRYEVSLRQKRGQGRHIILDLYPNGTAVMFTHMENKNTDLEEHGKWGVNSDRGVEVTWPRREQTMQYVHSDSTLIATSKDPDIAKLIMRLTGAPDPMHGVTGDLVGMIKNIQNVGSGEPPSMDEPLSEWLTAAELDQFRVAIQKSYSVPDTNFATGGILTGNLTNTINYVRTLRKH